MFLRRFALEAESQDLKAETETGIACPSLKAATAASIVKPVWIIKSRSSALFFKPIRVLSSEASMTGAAAGRTADRARPRRAGVADLVAGAVAEALGDLGDFGDVDDDPGLAGEDRATLPAGFAAFLAAGAELPFATTLPREAAPALVLDAAEELRTGAVLDVALVLMCTDDTPSPGHLKRSPGEWEARHESTNDFADSKHTLAPK